MPLQTYGFTTPRWVFSRLGQLEAASCLSCPGAKFRVYVYESQSLGSIATSALFPGGGWVSSLEGSVQHDIC